MVGGTNGGIYIMMNINYFIFFIVLCDALSPAFAPKDANQSRLRAAFFVSGIQLLQALPFLCL